MTINCDTLKIRITKRDIDKARLSWPIHRNPALVITLERLGMTMRKWSGNWTEFFVDGQSIGSFLITKTWVNAMAEKAINPKKSQVIILKNPYRPPRTC